MEAQRRQREPLRFGLGLRLIGLAVLIALAAGGLVSAALIENSRAVIRGNILENNLATADLAAQFAANYVEGAETNVRQFATRPSLLRAVFDNDVEQAELHLAQFLQIDARFDNIAIYDSQGIGWASGLLDQWQNRGGSVADREWFTQTLATRQPYLGIPVLSRGTGHPVVSYAVPLFDEQGKLRAMLVGGLSLDALSDAITGLRGSTSARASLMDSRQGGLILAHPDAARILSPVTGQNAAAQRALAGERGTLETTSSSGELDLAAFAPVPRLPWAVLILEPASVAFAPVNALTQRALLLTGAAMLAAAALGLLLARTITRPLQQLVRGAEALGQGRLEQPLPVQSRDEIGQLAAAFNTMAANLRALLGENTRLYEETRAWAGELERRVEERTAELAQANAALQDEITERKRVEEALRDLAVRQEALLAAIPDIIMEVDTNKVYTWANQAGRKFFGAEVIGREAAFYFEGEQNTYAAVQPLFNGDENTLYVESWQRRKDGQKRLLAWWCRVLKDDRGNPTGALSSARDITASRRAEEESVRAAQEWQTTFDATNDALWILDQDQRVMRSNQAAERLFPRPSGELIGRHCWEIVHGTAQPIPDCPILRMQASLRRESMELQIGEGYFQVTVDPILDTGGQLCGAVHIVSDITQRVRTEAVRRQAEERLTRVMQDLARSNTELEQFANVASHDLQEPLRMVTSYTQLLAQRYQGQLDADADEFIGYAVGGVKRMQTLLNDLLAYARVGSRGRPFEPVDCEDVAQQALLNLSLVIDECNALVTCDSLPTVWGDEAQLIQLFQNLLGNALKFHGGQPPRIHISARQTFEVVRTFGSPETSKVYEFSVRDNGIGIDSQHFERIFVIFQRLHTRDEYPGTGIGLAICKKIVERHGGRLWVESEPDHGATFFFTLSPVP